MTKFIQDLERGMVFGLRCAVSAYLCLTVVVLTGLMPIPLMFVAGDAAGFGLDLIWNK